MLRSRVTPCLLIQDGGLVKTTGFKNPKYVGDPINAVRIFNEKEADEVIVLDIDASVNNVAPDYKLIGNIAKECRMPLCYGGGIKTLAQVEKIISLGVEKVALSSVIFDRPNLISEISEKIGRQSVVVVLDIKKKMMSDIYNVWTHNGTKNTKRNVLDVLEQVQNLGVGEVVLNFIDLDGTMKGYAINTVKYFKNHVSVPLTILGGAKSLDDMGSALSACGLIGLSAGSLFVFKGKHRAVLINYPSRQKKEELIYSNAC